MTVSLSRYLFFLLFCAILGVMENVATDLVIEVSLQKSSIDQAPEAPPEGGLEANVDNSRDIATTPQVYTHTDPANTLSLF